MARGAAKNGVMTPDDAVRRLLSMMTAAPDTLSGKKRADMMRQLSELGGDTTQVTQEGIGRMLEGTLLDSLSQAYGVDHQVFLRPYTAKTLESGYVDTENPEQIFLNMLHAFLPDTRANVKYTPAEAEMAPEDRLRQVIMHEFGHVAGMGETNSDKQAAVFDALSRANDDATVRDVLFSAAQSYYDNRNAYKDDSNYNEDGTPRDDRVHEMATHGYLLDQVRQLLRSGLFPEPHANKFTRWLSNLFGGETDG